MLSIFTCFRAVDEKVIAIFPFTSQNWQSNNKRKFREPNQKNDIHNLLIEIIEVNNHAQLLLIRFNTMFKDLKKNTLCLAFVLIPALVMLVSCGPERMIGNYYIKHSPKGSILLLRPNLVYKNNHMRFDLSDQMNETEKDSVAYYRSSYLQYISDSAFLDEYMNNFIDRMLSAGYDVFAQEYIDSFMIVGPPSYIVNVAQLQLEESRDSSGFESNGMDEDGNYYPSEIILNAVRLNSWFEITELNADSGKVKKSFFASSIARDAVKGGLKIIPETGELRFQYTIDTITLNDVHELARQSGKTYGDYLTDYFMNEYIRHQMPVGVFPHRYMHYDPDLRRVRNSKGEGFQEIEPTK